MLIKSLLGQFESNIIHKPLIENMYDFTKALVSTPTYYITSSPHAEAEDDLLWFLQAGGSSDYVEVFTGYRGSRLAPVTTSGFTEGAF